MGFFDESTGGLVVHWKSKSAITNLVGAGSLARIYGDGIKKDAVEPFIEYVRAGGLSENHLLDASGTGTTILHVYCYDTSPGGSDALAAAVRANTIGIRGTYTGTYVNQVVCTDTPDSGRIDATDQGDTQRYWSRVILRITHEEPVAA